MHWQQEDLWNAKCLSLEQGAFWGQTSRKPRASFPKKLTGSLRKAGQLQGGVAVGETQTTKEPYLLQAIVWP